MDSQHHMRKLLQVTLVGAGKHGACTSQVLQEVLVQDALEQRRCIKDGGFDGPTNMECNTGGFCEGLVIPLLDLLQNGV